MASRGGTNGHDTIRIVLLGKTGAGKSSLGNALTGLKPPPKGKGGKDDRESWKKKADEGFKIGKGLKSETIYSAYSGPIPKRDGTVLEVTDTPGLCDTHLPEKRIYREVAKSVAVAEPGPNVIIFALRCDRRFTEEEYSAYKKIKRLFSEDMNRYLILVFNGLDSLGDEDDSLDEMRDALEEEIAKFGGILKDMITEAGGRYFGMNNKAPGDEKDEQVDDLVKMMKELIKANGTEACYKTSMTEKIAKEVEELVKEEARVKGMDSSAATTSIKTKIISEEVKPGFFEAIGSYVVSAASAVAEGVSEMCSVM